MPSQTKTDQHSFIDETKMKEHPALSDHSSPKILAGIVLYEPDLKELEESIENLKKQCDAVLLVDNASSNRQGIEELVRKTGVIWKRNPKNLGIAKALNQILEYALDHDYDWYLSMDQDSAVDPLMVETMLEKTDENTGIICPFLLNNGKITMEQWKEMDLPKTEKITDPILCITSAALTNTKKAAAIGGYRDDLFIDCVDVDFNIRMMPEFEIIKDNTTWILQQMGQGKAVPVMEKLYQLTGKKAFARLSVSPVYSDFRLYHIARNSRFMHQIAPDACGKQMQPAWMLGQFAYYLATYPKERSRLDMIRSLAKGWKDAKTLNPDAPEPIEKRNIQHSSSEISEGSDVTRQEGSPC